MSQILLTSHWILGFAPSLASYKSHGRLKACLRFWMLKLHVKNALARYIWLLICKRECTCMCACVMHGGRIYGSEFQAGKQCEFLWVNLLRCSTGTVSSGNKWFYYVFVLAKALVICQKLMTKEWQRWRKHKKAMSMLVCVWSSVKEVRVGLECLFTHK